MGGASESASLDLGSFRNAQLRGGISIELIAIAPGPLLDISGGPAFAHTSMNVGTGVMTIEVVPGLSTEEQSVSIYHEVIEAASLQSKQPPSMILDLSEQEIDFLARMAHQQYGPVTVEALNELLTDLGF